MADIIDSASEIEELQRNTAIKMRRLNYQTVSATHCCESGDPIDERRRQAVQGCRTCASCQVEIVLKNKQWGLRWPQSSKFQHRPTEV